MTASAASPLEAVGKIRWLGRAGFLLQGGRTVYVDPVAAPAGLPKADIVFLTHVHENHCSDKDVEAVSAASTIVAGPKECVSRFRLNQLPIRPGDAKEILGISVRAVASYDPAGGEHPKDRSWLGYAFDFGGTTVYHPGDSGWTPEMSSERPDVLLWPVAGPCGFAAASRQDLAGYLKALGPKIVIPMHYRPGPDQAAVDLLRAAAEDVPCEMRILENTAGEQAGGK